MALTTLTVEADFAATTNKYPAQHTAKVGGKTVVLSDSELRWLRKFKLTHA